MVVVALQVELIIVHVVFGSKDDFQGCALRCIDSFVYERFIVNLFTGEGMILGDFEADPAELCFALTTSHMHTPFFL